MPTARALIAWLLAAVLGACAAPRPTTTGEPPEPAPAPVALEIEAPDPLGELLREHLDLAHVDRLLRSEPLRPEELERLVAATPAQVRSLLRTEGYYAPEIDVRLLDREPPRVRVAVNPGPRTVVGTVDLDVQGPLVDDAQRGLRPALAAREALHEAWPLQPGEPFTDAGWGAAKSAPVARVRAHGYVDARWRSTTARVDAAAHRADLSATLDSGPLFRTGPLRIEGLNHHDARTVRNIADFEPGTPATEDLLLDFQERLLKADLFERATVTLEPDPEDPSHTPVRVRLAEQQLQQATFGVGVDANVGPRASVEHVHRRPFGQAWLARNRLEWAQLRQGWEGELSTHTLPGLYRNLVGGTYERVESDTDVVITSRVRLGRAQETERISRLVFAEYERSTARSDVRRERADALAVHYHGIWRKVDHPLLPTRGHVWVGQVGAGYATSDPGGHGPFTRLYGRLHAYRPIGSWYGQGRVELGQVFSRSDVLVPAAMRFRAGGDESVRGYEYRSLAPVENGVEVSGKVLFTASAEIARPILQRMPELWGAAFIDVGRAAMRWSDLDPAVGVGVGVRYRSPVGPVKLDLAWGEEVQRLRLHLSVGVAF